jgi:2-methylisocitrate lyase-like PEP mutase family enzyme
MSPAPSKYEQFLSLHHQDEPLLMPNAWDAGSTRAFAELGFHAVATTSSGFAGTLGRLDGEVTREQALEHGRVLAAASDLPVSADLENCFADSPAGVAGTVTLACATGLAGCSVEDYSREKGLYDAGLARERVAAAAEAAHASPTKLVLSARAENQIRNNPDLADTIARLQSFQEAGADVLFAPGVRALDEIRALVSSVDLPVNVLVGPGMPPIGELAAAGVKRFSVGGALYFAGLGAVADAARELLEQGTYNYGDMAGAGVKLARAAFTA